MVELQTTLLNLLVKVIATIGSKTFWACVLLTLQFLQTPRTMTLIEYVAQVLVVCGVFKVNDIIDIVKAKSPAGTPPAK